MLVAVEFFGLRLGVELLVGRRLLQLLEARLQAGHGTLEADDLVLERSDLAVGSVEPLSRIERVLDHKLLQEIDVGLQASRALVQALGLGAILNPRDVLGLRCAHDTHDIEPDRDENPDAQRCDPVHLFPSPAPSPDIARNPRMRMRCAAGWG